MEMSYGVSGDGPSKGTTLVFVVAALGVVSVNSSPAFFVTV